MEFESFDCKEEQRTDKSDHWSSKVREILFTEHSFPSPSALK